MKKMKLTALFLAILLAFSCLTPLMSFAADAEEAAETFTAVPYRLRTQSVDEKTNQVKVWLELSPAIAESVAAYQIELQLENKEGMSVAGRKMELAFDTALDAAKIKETKFDEATQTMKVFVAATSNLVQTSADKDGNIANTLPIGTVTVEKMSNKAENPFKIVMSGKTGNLKTVGMDQLVYEAAEVYGMDFEIPVDGTVFSVLDYTFEVSKTGEGTVKAYKVNADGTEELFNDYSAAENTVVRLDISPAAGYVISKVTATDKATGKDVAVGNDYSFILTGDTDVKVVFEKKIVNYSFTLKTSGKGSVKAYKVENGKETAIENGSYASGTVIRLDAKAEDGYKVAKVTVKDKKTGAVKTLKGDYSFTLSSDSEVTVTFEKETTPSTDPSKPSCSCNCHKTGIAKFFWKISNFFSKLFKIESKHFCACGEVDHWKI